jgi:hypothetical protein
MIDEVRVNPDVPTRFSRSQVALRVAVVLALSVLGAPVAWGFGALYLLLPVVAAIVISSRGPQGYLESEGTRVLELLRWWTAFVGYLLFLSDRFPLEARDFSSVRLVVGGSNATVGNALLRLLTSLPVVLLLAPLWWLAGILAVLALLSVLLTESVPPICVRYFAFVTELQVQLLVYLASLTDRYPLSEKTPRTHEVH